MPEMTGGQALVRALRAEGVDTVFALPGVQIMPLFDALYEVQDDIDLVQARHEQATAYMADGYAKATGKVGVAMVVPGPGALNATAALGTAYASSSPVLLISGQMPSHAFGKRRGELHEVEDQLDVFRPITKWAHRATSVEEIPGAVHEAMRHLTTGRPRPVELEVPSDILLDTGSVDLIEPERFPGEPLNQSDINLAASILHKAENPIIIAGGGTIVSDASAGLVALAEFLQAPVVTTHNAKGVIPETHYLSVGVHYYSVSPLPTLWPESDVILAVGTRLMLGELNLSEGQKLIHIDADPEEIGRNIAPEVGIVADAGEGLARLIESVRAAGPQRDSRRAEIERHKQAFKDNIRDLAPDQVGIIDTVRGALNDDAIVVSGITNIGYWSNVAYPVLQPRTYLTTSYFATLGFAFPTALGAKVACPERQVVALCGDGGFMYSPQELSTAVAQGINVVAVVFNNSAFGASEWDQTHRFNKRFIGTALSNPDFVDLAHSFGAMGLRTDPEGLSEALQEALAAETPVLLEVVLPNMMPPFQIVP